MEEMALFFKMLLLLCTVIRSVDVFQVDTERITQFKYQLQKTESTEAVYQACFSLCFKKNQCEVVGYKSGSGNGNEVLCSFFTNQTVDPDQICHRIPGTNILIDPDTIYFHRKIPLKVPYDCSDVMAGGFFTSGVYTVYPDWGDPDGIQVYCDMETDGGGWMIFHRRIDGSVNFDRNWEQWKTGFGEVNGEYYLGNERIHKFTHGRNYQLRIDVADWEGGNVTNNYLNFGLASESDCYRLTLTGYSGDTGVDDMANSNGQCFTTKDRDQDTRSTANCAQLFWRAWWHWSCFIMNLNGHYLQVQGNIFAKGIVVQSFRGLAYSLKSAEMKMRINEC